MFIDRVINLQRYLRLVSAHPFAHHAMIAKALSKSHDPLPLIVPCTPLLISSPCSMPCTSAAACAFLADPVCVAAARRQGLHG